MYLAGVYTLLIFTLYHNARKNLVNKTTRFARRNNCPLWGDGKDDARREARI